LFQGLLTTGPTSGYALSP